MNEFTWRDHYKIGNATVDAQHRRVFELANRIVEAGDTEEITRLAMLFYQHTREHFQAEETLMKQYSYPDYQTHVDAHNLMLDRLIEISTAIRNKQLDPAGIGTFVNDWVLEHILKLDMLFGGFLQQGGRA